MKNVAVIAFAAMLFASPSFASDLVASAPNVAPTTEVGFLESVENLFFGLIIWHV